ncbi:MAG: hypothetical protein H7Y38_04785 [Armatimonadetes bacterium]|nr:hypothetical protein [Armatimonadota bacterium]
MEAKTASDQQILTLRLELALARLGTGLPGVTNTATMAQIPGAKND